VAKSDNMFPKKKNTNEDPFQINQEEKNEILNLPDYKKIRK
jgi:hypothetical protein